MEIYLSDAECEEYEWVGNKLYLDGEAIYQILRATPDGLYVMEVTHD